jgi:hypothetical protein
MSRQPSYRSEFAANPGYRAAEAYIRPSPVATHGRITKFGFDLQNCTFTLSLVAESATTDGSPTVIYLPAVHFPRPNTEVSVSGGKWKIETQEYASGATPLLKWWHAEGDQDIKIVGVKRKLGSVVDRADDDGYIQQCQQNSCILM